MILTKRVMKSKHQLAPPHNIPYSSLSCTRSKPCTTVMEPVISRLGGIPHHLSIKDMMIANRHTITLKIIISMGLHNGLKSTKGNTIPKCEIKHGITK